MIPSIDFAFLVICFMWDPHYKSFEIVIPIGVFWYLL